MEASCDFFNSSMSCYTASWYLIWDQVRLWLLIQILVLLLSIIYEWLGISGSLLVNSVRKSLSKALPVFLLNMMQLVTSTYVCTAWIARGGSLAVDISSWSVESAFLIMGGIAYAVRWLAAKNKIRYVISLEKLLDLLSIVSHFAISFQTTYDDGAYKRSWLDFGFLRSYLLFNVVSALFATFKHKTFGTQLSFIAFKFCCLVFFAASMLFFLERLGDIPGDHSYLLHVYECYNKDRSKSYLSGNKLGKDGFNDCSETWSLFVAVYFMFVTLSTVGYGDFSPNTVLGEIVVCIIIVVGIYTFASASGAITKVYGDTRNTRVRYSRSHASAHIILTGNPSFVQVTDFIREFYHSDHEMAADSKNVDFANSNSSDSSTTKSKYCTVHSQLSLFKYLHLNSQNIRKIDIVILLQYEDKSDSNSSRSSSISVLQLKKFINENKIYRRHVVFLHGSPLASQDLLRAKLYDSCGVFFLPNKFCTDMNEEDAATLVRVLSVTQKLQQKQQAFPKLYAILLNSENTKLLQLCGISNERLVCADDIRCKLLGIGCESPGLPTLLSNLLTSQSNDLPTKILEGENHMRHKLWIYEYMEGAAKEIYSCEMAARFSGAHFSTAAQIIFEESDGEVLLLAIETSEILLAPGNWLKLPLHCKCFLIADSKSAINPFKAQKGSSQASQSPQRQCNYIEKLQFLAEDRYFSDSNWQNYRERLISRAKHAQHTVERRIPSHIRELLQTKTATKKLPFPPPQIIANGGHIIICNYYKQNNQLGFNKHLEKILTPLRAIHTHAITPIIIIDPSYLKSITELPAQLVKLVYQIRAVPHHSSVLDSAGVHTASTIVFLGQRNVMSEHDNLTAVMSAIMIRNILQQRNPTIHEIWDMDNPNKFYTIAQQNRNSNVRPNRFSERLKRKKDAERNNFHLNYVQRNFNNFKVLCCHIVEFFLGDLPQSDTNFGPHLWMQKKFFPSDNLKLTDRKIETYLEEKRHTNGILVTERYMSGKLFPSDIADTLLLQSFYNSSIIRMFDAITSHRNYFILYSVPYHLRSSNGVLFHQIFHYFALKMAQSLVIGILRGKDGVHGAHHSYVYSCPCKTALVYPNDRLYVIIHIHSIDTIVRKIQRRVRKTKHRRA